jgi:hypothetical protein
MIRLWLWKSKMMWRLTASGSATWDETTVLALTEEETVYRNTGTVLETVR